MIQVTWMARGAGVEASIGVGNIKSSTGGNLLLLTQLIAQL